MVLGLVVFAVYLYFFIGSSQILLVLKSINPIQYALYYSLAILAVLGSVFCWSAAWNSILRKLSIKISYRKSYLYYWVGNFADLIVPCATVCGEVTRLYLVQKETNENYGAIAASSVTNRIVAYSVVTTGLFTGAVLVLSKTNVPPMIGNLFILLVLGSAAYLAVLLVLAFYRGAAEIFVKLYVKVNKRIRPNKNSPEDIAKIKETLSSFYQGFKVFRENPRALAKPFMFHIAAYVLGLSVYVFVFYALGIPAPSPVFYIVVYFVATAFQDAIASFSVGSLDILLSNHLHPLRHKQRNKRNRSDNCQDCILLVPALRKLHLRADYGGKKPLHSKPKDMRKALEERKLPDKPMILLEQQTPQPIVREPCPLPSQQIQASQLSGCPSFPPPEVLVSKAQPAEE